MIMENKQEIERLKERVEAVESLVRLLSWLIGGFFFVAGISIMAVSFYISIFLSTNVTSFTTVQIPQAFIGMVSAVLGFAIMLSGQDFGLPTR